MLVQITETYTGSFAHTGNLVDGNVPPVFTATVFYFQLYPNNIAAT
jgi:hypothetical protein